MNLKKIKLAPETQTLTHHGYETRRFKMDSFFLVIFPLFPSEVRSIPDIQILVLECLSPHHSTNLIFYGPHSYAILLPDCFRDKKELVNRAKRVYLKLPFPLCPLFLSYASSGSTLLNDTTFLAGPTSDNGILNCQISMSKSF